MYHSSWYSPWCNIPHKPSQTNKHLLIDICQHLKSQHPPCYIHMAQILCTCITAVRHMVTVWSQPQACMYVQVLICLSVDNFIWAVRVSNNPRALEENFVTELECDERLRVSGHLCSLRYCSLRSKCFLPLGLF